MSELLVIALGGNALIPSPDARDIPSQYQACYQTCGQIAQLIQRGYRVVITHGNGPQVGFVLRRSELSRTELHEVPLDICVADTQGAIGSMFQRAMHNQTKTWDNPPQIVSMVTHVVVDPEDPDFQDPSKPIGSFINDAERVEEIKTQGWHMMHDPKRGHRRVVPSPKPKEIVELSSIHQLLELGVCVIACGGGGIPVQLKNDGSLDAVEAVIDKDLTSSMLARQLGADRLFIATNIDGAYKHYDTDEQERLGALPVSEMEASIQAGEFGRGSMLPKIQAAVDFVKQGGKEAVIGHLHQLAEFMSPEVGTHIQPDPTN